MATIDDIRIKLAVDAAEVASGIKRVSSVMDTELRKKRTAQVNLTLHEDTKVKQAIDDLARRIKAAGKVEVQVQLADFDAAPIAKALTDDLKQLPGGGVKVPVVLDTKLSKREMQNTQRDLRAAIGIITVDWQLAGQPKGGWPEPPPGWGGGGGGFSGPSGGGPAPAGPAPAGPAPAGAAPRSPEQQTNDARRRKAMADVKKAKASADKEATRLAEEELKQATVERDRLAKERRENDTTERKARAAQDRESRAAKKAQAETEAPEAPGIGGRKAGQRSAARKAKEVPTGAPEGNILIKAPKTLPGTERPPNAMMGRGDPLANTVGKGKEEKFRRSAAPRDLMAAGLEMTTEGEARSKMGLPLGPEHFKTIVKQGETPKTLNPMMGARMEQRLGKQRAAGLRSWADEMSAAGVGGGLTTVEDARAYFKSLPPGTKRAIHERMGLPPDTAERLGGAMDPLNDPATMEAFLVMLGERAERFDEQAEHTAGGIVNINAGARLKDPPTRVKGGGAITGGAIEQALKQASLPLAKRGRKPPPDKEEVVPPGGFAAPAPPVPPKMRDKQLRPEEIARVSQIEGATAHLPQTRLAQIRAGLTNLTPEAPVDPERMATPYDPLKFTTSPVTAELADKERAEAIKRAKRVAAERAKREAATRPTAPPPGAFKMRIPGAPAQAEVSQAAAPRRPEDIEPWKPGAKISVPSVGDVLGPEKAARYSELVALVRESKAEHDRLVKQGDSGNALTAVSKRYVSLGNELDALHKAWRAGWKPKGRAEGGLLARMAQAGDQRAEDLLGPDPQAYDPNELDPDDLPHTLRQWNDLGKREAVWVTRARQQAHGLSKDLTRRAEGGKLPRWLFTQALERDPFLRNPFRPEGDNTSPFWDMEARDAIDLASHDRLTNRMWGRFDPELRLALVQGAFNPFQDVEDPETADVATRPMETGDILPFGKNAEGGELRHTGLLGRMAQRGDPRAVTLVGERGPELIVTDERGESEVVPTHQVPTWLQRAREGKGFGKDLTGRAAGGPVSFNMRGRTGFQSTAQISRGTVSGGDIARVFVVNWPSAFTGQGGGPAVRVTPTTPTGKPITMAAASGVATPKAATPQGVLPTAAAVAAAQPTPQLLPSQDPRVRSEVEAGFLKQRFKGRQELQTARTNVGVALAENPVRAFAVAFSQFVQTKTGRGELLERAGAARVAIQEADAARAAEASTKRRLDYEQRDADFLRQKGTLTDKEAEQLAFLDQVIPRRVEALQLEAHNAELSTREATILSEGLSGVGAQLTNLAVGAGSVITAGFLFSGAMAAMNAAVQIGGAIIGDFVEQATGFSGATAQMNKDLAQATRQAGGNSRVAVDQVLAQSAMNDATSESIRQTLANRAATIAANQAIHQQTEQQSAAKSAAEQSAQAGLPEGFDASLVRGTGGPFNLGLLPGILSDRSTADELAIRLRQAPQIEPPGGSESPPPWMIPFVNVEANRQARELRNAGAETDLAEVLSSINQQGEGPDLVRIDPADPRVQQTIDAFKSLGTDAGTQLAAELENRQRTGQGIGLTGDVSRFSALQFLNGQAQGSLAPKPGNLLDALFAPKAGGLSTLDAGLRDIRRRAGFQREVAFPASAALAFAARPIPAFNDSRLRPSGTVGGVRDTEGTVAAYETAFKKYAQFAEPAQARINMQVEKGRRTLSEWVGPDLLGQITDLGKGIQDIQLGITQRGLNLEVSQYNNEIRIATRQWNQAKDFSSSIRGNVKDTIGGLQGQNYQLSRQLQLLQQQQQQRQINLQLAVAGFQVAGETPEERAARQDAAQAEAAFAQKQLDLQKQMGTNEFTVGLKENANAITDLSAQISLLREGKSLAIDSAAAEEAIKRMDADLELLQQQAQSRMDEALQMSDVQLGIIADIEKETGETFDRWQEKLFPAFRKAGSEAGKAATDFVVASIIQAYGTSFPAPNSSGSPDDRQEQSDLRIRERQINQDLNGNGIIGAATGMLANTTGATGPVIFGEAGKETVAILRNPREGSFGGFGGGGVTVNINLNGNVSMRNDADIAILAQKIEERLSYRLQMTRRA